MPPAKPAITVLGVRVFVPGNSVVGLALIAWFAIPTSQEVLGSASEVSILLLSVAHALALYFSIFIHELGHAWSAMRRKYPVEGITLTIIGGHTTVQTSYRSPKDQASIALAGPVATLLVGVAAWAFATVTSGTVHSVASWLAWSSVIIGAVNLLPGVPLDGGAILDAIVWRLSKNRSTGRRVSALSGFGVAVLWATSPWIVGSIFDRPVQTADVIISAVVGLWMASTAWRAYVWSTSALGSTVEPSDASSIESIETAEAIGSTESTGHDTALAIRPYVRRTILVPLTETVESALSMAANAGAGAVLVGTAESVAGIVRDSAVACLSEEQKSLSPVSSVARRIGDDDYINVNSTTDSIADQLAVLSSEEWLVVDDSKAIVGVLIRSDLQRNIRV